MNMNFYSLFITLFLLAIGASSTIQASVNEICDASIEKVSQTTSVPKKVLYKIARLESGRHFKGKHVSWPWSLNNAGKGYFFETKKAALSKLGGLISRGEKNIDLGCMQLNLRWHARYFDSLEEMIAPTENVSYAAKFLEELYKETGSWEQAVRFYHSRNSKYNTIYYAKYQKMPVPYSSQNDKIFSVTQLANLESEFAVQSNKINAPLFWVKPTGAMIDFRPNEAAVSAFADLRDFKMPPLFKM